MMVDPIHQFEIRNLVTVLQVGGHEIHLTNSAIFMFVAAAAAIARAEAQALADVRNAAADAAVAAAETILVEVAKGEAANRIMAHGIKNVKAAFPPASP